MAFISTPVPVLALISAVARGGLGAAGCSGLIKATGASPDVSDCGGVREVSARCRSASALSKDMEKCSLADELFN